MMSTSATRESRGSHLHPQINTRIHLLPRKSTIHYKVKSTSNVQRYDPMPLVLSANNYQLIVLGHTTNVHLIPFGNVNDKKKSIPWPSLLYYTVPWAIWSTPSMHSLTFQVPLAPPSQRVHPLERLPRIRDTKDIIPSYISYHDHGNQWILLGTIAHNGPSPKGFTSIACSWQSMDIIGHHYPIMALLLKALVAYCCLFQFPCCCC